MKLPTLYPARIVQPIQTKLTEIKLRQNAKRAELAKQKQHPNQGA